MIPSGDNIRNKLPELYDILERIDLNLHNIGRAERYERQYYDACVDFSEYLEKHHDTWEGIRDGNSELTQWIYERLPDFIQDRLREE